MKQRVVVGLSGGVDSSVAAALLLDQGYDVIGVFMKNWDDSSLTIDDECPWIDDSQDALLVAQKLGIPFQVLDMTVEYKDRIVDYMISEYDRGLTPNPDVLCNREIKFDLFLKKALSLGADFVATGHYCQKAEIEKDGKTIYRLIEGKDSNKDQSYFLCQIDQYQLSKALFPIGHLTKPEVRAIAESRNLVTANKKDSQGLCFIGKIKLPDFLQGMLSPNPGEVVLVQDRNLVAKNETDELENKVQKPILVQPDNKIMGKHNGIQFYTTGQRKGLGIGGTKEPLFVLGKNMETNQLYVGIGESHQALFREGIFIANNDIHWIRPDLELAENQEMDVMMRIRYRQALFGAKLYKRENGLYIIFETKQKSIAPGQFAAWYIQDELIGSGVIS